MSSPHHGCMWSSIGTNPVANAEAAMTKRGPRWRDRRRGNLAPAWDPVSAHAGNARKCRRDHAHQARAACPCRRRGVGRRRRIEVGRSGQEQEYASIVREEESWWLQPVRTRPMVGLTTSDSRVCVFAWQGGRRTAGEGAPLIHPVVEGKGMVTPGNHRGVGLLKYRKAPRAQRRGDSAKCVYRARQVHQHPRLSKATERRLQR